MAQHILPYANVGIIILHRRSSYERLDNPGNDFVARHSTFSNMFICCFSDSFPCLICVFNIRYFVRVCLMMPCGHLLGRGWPLGSRL